MSRKKLNPEDCRIKFSITINPILFAKVNELKKNKSKYIEQLIYNNLLKDKQINKNIEL